MPEYSDKKNESSWTTCEKLREVVESCKKLGEFGLSIEDF